MRACNMFKWIRVFKWIRGHLLCYSDIMDRFGLGDKNTREWDVDFDTIYESSIYLSIYLPTYLPSYLSIYLSVHLNYNA